MASTGKETPGDPSMLTHHPSQVTAPNSGVSKKQHETEIIGIVGAVSAVIALCLLALIIYIRWRRGVLARKIVVKEEENYLENNRKLLLCPRNKYSNSGLLTSLSLTPKTHIRFLFEDLNIATSGFDEKNLLGEGGFGRVYKGVLPLIPFTKVAIKALTGTSSQGVKEFVTEIELLSRLDHKHLVRLLGSCMVGEQLYLVYRHVANGSLSDHLHGENRQTKTYFPWGIRVKIALGAALGIQYLHQQKPTVLHRDIKAANILLTGGFNAKVCDFGFAKQLTGALDDPVRFCCTPSRSGALGTLGYVAPESMMTGEVSSASDVYSFGVVMLELLTGRKPLDFSLPEKDQSLVNWSRMYLEQERVSELLDSDMPDDIAYIRESALLFMRMTRLCLGMDPRERPNMNEVVQTLQVLRAEFESRIDAESINLSVSLSDSGSSDSASDTSEEKSADDISSCQFDDITILDMDQFSQRFLEAEGYEQDAMNGDLSSKNSSQKSGGPFKPLSWLSHGFNKPPTPTRG
ncbi:protein MpRLK-Pelle_RLCK-XVI [Marchantia polymorpha subsp. ruderalis]|uniref:Protein kinase domain-containing protein n=2 Tax=Marchantia polymorpha TaxID=3197 RepID=A0AAF6AT90_MARPO|nr:hypothetical protein MARPO_0065s0093 [Marchantia polymorpha]BBM99660.1 hypothetical protein Mp_1g22840 [Marchantia polymorpha subsp. ruderalis]|eukprot:PTQ36297.1 hypothetical protein MARPO_0065s0093 [Marchantia polymorpha]